VFDWTVTGPDRVSRPAEGISEMTHIKAFAFSSVVVLLSGLLVSRAQESAPAEDATLAAAAVEHPECSLFVQRDKKKSAGDSRMD